MWVESLLREDVSNTNYVNIKYDNFKGIKANNKLTHASYVHFLSLFSC